MRADFEFALCANAERFRTLHDHSAGDGSRNVAAYAWRGRCSRNGDRQTFSGDPKSTPCLFRLDRRERFTRTFDFSRDDWGRILLFRNRDSIPLIDFAFGAFC